MGVPADELLSDGMDHPVHLQAGQLGLKHDLEEQVAELLLVMGRISLVDGVQHLVGFLQ